MSLKLIDGHEAAVAKSIFDTIQSGNNPLVGVCLKKATY